MVEIDDKFKESMLNRDEKLERFDKYGITDDYLIGKLKDELEASEITEKRISRKETKQVSKPLWKIRQDARKDAHKLKGDYPAEKHEHTGDVIFHSNVPEPDAPEEEKEEKPGKPPLSRDPEVDEEALYDVAPQNKEMPAEEGELPIDVQHPTDVDKLVEQMKYKHKSCRDALNEDLYPTSKEEKPEIAPKKEPEEFKNHHKSRRDAGK